MAKTRRVESAVPADLVRSWSDGYRAGMSDGIAWVMSRIDEGMTRAEAMRQASRRFAEVGDHIDRYWSGKASAPDHTGRDELAERFKSKQ